MYNTINNQLYKFLFVDMIFMQLMFFRKSKFENIKVIYTIEEKKQILYQL